MSRSFLSYYDGFKEDQATEAERYAPPEHGPNFRYKAKSTPEAIAKRLEAARLEKLTLKFLAL